MPTPTNDNQRSSASPPSSPSPGNTLADAAALRAVVGAGAAVVNLHWVKRCAELWRLCEETDSRPREIATKAIQAARQSHQYINLNAPPPIVPAARTIITRQQPQPAQTQATLRTQPTQAAPQPQALLLHSRVHS
ncbi:BRCT domain-containing protein [Pseudoscourfieldia marina]